MRASMFRNRQRAHGQRGFSLVELLVVVAIIGMLATVAAVSMSTDPEIEDECKKVAAMVNEAARQAISGGSVSPEISATTSIVGRGQVRLVGDTTNPVLLIERFREPTVAVPDLAWVERKRFYLGQRARLAGFSRESKLGAGSFPDEPPPFSPTDTETFLTRCNPDGTCTPMTLYLEDAKRPERKARVVVLQLNGMMTQCFSGW